MSAPARDGLATLPSDILGHILMFGDLRGRFACVAAGQAIRDGVRGLSPNLERDLVVRRYPILAAVVGRQGAPSPRELYLSHQALLDVEGEEPLVEATTLECYDFVLELEIMDKKRRLKSIHVNTAGICRSSTRGVIEFDIPGEVFDRIKDEDAYCAARLMAVRDGNSGVEHSLLMYIIGSFVNDRLISFYPGSIPMHPLMQWCKAKIEDTGLHLGMSMEWARDVPQGQSTLSAKFLWFDDEDEFGEVMSVEDARMTMENVMLWSGSPIPHKYE